MWDDWDNGGGGNGTGTNWNSPTATTDGAVWIKSGTSLVQVSTDLNMALYWRRTRAIAGPRSSAILLNNQNNTSNGAGGPYAHASGYTDVTGSIPPDGYFLDPHAAPGWGTRPAHSSYKFGGGGYYLPVTGSSFAGEQFRMQAWTGNYPSYAAAVAGYAGGDHTVLVGDTGANGFAVSDVHYPGDINPDENGSFEDMPALVVTTPTATPEPSTFILLAAGLAGLLAYAWRKRR